MKSITKTIEWLNAQMPNKKQFGLKEKEFMMICDYRNGDMRCFKEPFWRYHFTSDLFEAIYENRLAYKWEVSFSNFKSKLLKLSDKELLSVMVEVDKYWRVNTEDYLYLKFTSPSVALSQL